jgi:murein L,D-transpeptidase YcbB/YkuD
MLFREIQGAHLEGLRPEDYHLAPIEALLTEIDNRADENAPIEPEILVDLDLLLTDAFLLYGSHLLAGHVNPETIHAEWLIESRTADLVAVLETVIVRNDVEQGFDNLRPTHLGYEGLKNALLRYEEIMKGGGWRRVPSGPKIEKGDQGFRVRALHDRLAVSDDLEPSEQDRPDLFDERLEIAVRRFQRRHGLEADGIVGRKTLKALNVPVSQRIRQIKTNLERWRWLPQDLGRRYILVNVANFELDVVENNQVQMTMPVIVGRRYRRTPVFTGTMTYMEMNPYWHVPPKIAGRDILPHIQRDIQYLARKKIRVFQSWRTGAPEIRPEHVEWSEITARSLSFKLLQEPGPENALGRVKFMFPNKFNVYLHDTPARELFKKTKRAFSSGCIRVERPIDLAVHLLQNKFEWARENLRAVVDSGLTEVIRLPEPMPVHLLYWTTWADQDGTIHFREDIYERDKQLEKELDRRPPSPAVAWPESPSWSEPNI